MIVSACVACGKPIIFDPRCGECLSKDSQQQPADVAPIAIAAAMLSERDGGVLADVAPAPTLEELVDEETTDEGVAIKAMDAAEGYETVELLEIVDDFLALALWHLESNVEKIPLKHAQLTLAGINYATYLADAIGQEQIIPMTSKRTRAVIRHANGILRTIATRPRIILPKAVM